MTRASIGGDDAGLHRGWAGPDRGVSVWQCWWVPSLSADLAFRGLVHQVTGDGVLDLLDRGGAVTYAGFDPTAASLHVGNLVQLCSLRRLQLAGNPPIVLLGGGRG